MKVAGKERELKLDIGCGRFPAAGYVSVDRYEVADIECDMWDIPLGDKSVDEVRCVAAFEHIPWSKVEPTLKEWMRVLKPEGKLWLEVPDMDYMAKYWLEGPDRGWAVLMLFGLQTHQGEFHRCCWNAQGLSGDVQYCGFEIDTFVRYWNKEQIMLQLKAHKPKKARKVAKMFTGGVSGLQLEPLKVVGYKSPRSAVQSNLQFGERYMRSVGGMGDGHDAGGSHDLVGGGDGVGRRHGVAGPRRLAKRQDAEMSFLTRRNGKK